MNMSTFDNKRFLKDKLLIFGYIRTVIALQNYPPNDLIDLCIIFYHIKYNILKWSRKLNNNTFIFTDNDKCIQTLEQMRHCEYGWIQPDTLPIYKGIACWRIKVELYFITKKAI